MNLNKYDMAMIIIVCFTLITISSILANCEVRTAGKKASAYADKLEIQRLQAIKK